MTVDRLSSQLGRGAKFVMFQYCISVVVLTFKRPSAIYFVPAGESATARGIGFTALSLLLGWWGIPWGPIYTIQSVWVNSRGGRDVTREVAAALGATPPAPGAV